MDHTVQQKDLGPLHRLLLKASPADDEGRRSISVLARTIGLTPQALHYHCSRNRISGTVAKKIVDAAEGRVTLEDFHPFL